MRKLLNSISGIFYFTASIVHIWTVIVAFQQSGFLAAIVSLFAPILSEIYWMLRMWDSDSTYAQLALLPLRVSHCEALGTRRQHTAALSLSASPTRALNTNKLA